MIFYNLWFILGSGIILFLTGSLFLCLSYCKTRQKKSEDFLIRQGLNVPDYGFAFFNERGDAVYANDKLSKFIPDLFLGGKPGSYKDFLNYLYDHAIEADEGLKNMLMRAGPDDSMNNFREVIGWGHHKKCLVDVRKTEGGGAVIIVNDVSLVKDHEDQMVRLNDYSREVTLATDAATNGILVTKPVNDNHAVVFMNETCCRFLEWEKAEVVGKPVSEVLLKLSDANAQKRILETMRIQEQSDIEVPILKNKRKFWFNIKTKPVATDRDERLLISIFTDITALKIREEEFFQSQKLDSLGKLSAGIAHDFNNILAIVDGYARLLENGLGEEAQTLREYTEKIRKASTRGADLTQQMLLFSKHGAPGKENVIDLCQAIRDHDGLIKPLLEGAIVMDMKTEEVPLPVECSAGRITQIFMNLCLNARDAMKGAGHLGISVYKVSNNEELRKNRLKIDKEWACLSVTDNGEGMDEKTKSRVFDPFFTTKEPGRGTGLGLSVVYGIVRQIGGQISVGSEQGKGTVFSVYFPLSSKKIHSRSLKTKDDSGKLDLSGYVCMVAEDEEDLRKIYCSVLQDLGMEVISAANGNEALLKQDAYEKQIDLLVTDIVMPELDGIKLAKLFQAVRPETEVIFISGYLDETKRLAIPEEAALIPKPFDPAHLTKAIVEKLSNAKVPALKDSGRPCLSEPISMKGEKNAP